MGEEHEAWKKMCETIQKSANITPEEFSKDTWRPVVEQIERWAFYDRLRRKELKANKDWKPEWEFGMFWKGED